MTKSDVMEEWKELYSLRKGPRLVEVPEISFIMVDGVGDPKAPEFQEAINALYGLAYTIKFDLKKQGAEPHKIMPLEGQWWSQGEKFVMGPREEWLWTLMIAQPIDVTRSHFDIALDKLKRKKPSRKLDACRWESFKEGTCVQMLHLGPYSSEPETMAVMKGFMTAQGYQPRGKHHEIYMSDPRKGKPEAIKTIIRMPVSAHE